MGKRVNRARNKNRAMREQASKRVRGQGPDHVGRAFIELRQGSRAQPHRDRTLYNRNDFRFDDWD